MGLVGHRCRWGPSERSASTRSRPGIARVPWSATSMVAPEIKRTGPSKGAAERALKEAARDRTHSSPGAEITPDTPVKALAEKWAASLDQQSPTTRASHRNRVHAQIIPGLGGLRVHNLTVGTVDRFLQSVARTERRRVAKMTRSVLSGMCGLAARHDAHCPETQSGTRDPLLSRASRCRSP
jgi:hypothetical protein